MKYLVHKFVIAGNGGGMISSFITIFRSVERLNIIRNTVLHFLYLEQWYHKLSSSVKEYSLDKFPNSFFFGLHFNSCYLK